MHSLSLKPLLILTLAIGISMVSCKKDEPEVPAVTAPTTPAEPEPTEPEAQNPTPSQFGSQTENADGALIALKVVTTTEAGGQSFDVELGTGVAYFTETSGSFSSFADAGKVELNSKELEIQENKSYVYTPGTSDPTGISFSSGASWSIAGKGGTPAFTANFSDFPSTPKISSTSAIKKGTAYTLEFDASTADTIICALYSGSVSVLKGLKPKNGSNQVTFSASETKNVEAGESSGILQVAAANFSTTAQGTKTYILINESVTSKIVEVTE